MHSFVYQMDDDLNVTFICTKCSTELQFNKPSIGDPSAIFNGTIWETPPNPDKWISPCPE